MSDYRTPLPGMLAATLEKALNRASLQSVDTRRAIQQLHKRVLCLEIKQLEIRLYMSASDQRFKLSVEAPDAPVDTTISGSPLALFAMAIPDSGMQGRVDISGDATLARDVQNTLKTLNFDVEELITRRLGDVAGYQIARGLKRGTAWLRQSTDDTRDAVADYLREESGLLVRQTELDEFSRHTDELRDAVERIAAQLKQMAGTP